MITSPPFFVSIAVIIAIITDSEKDVGSLKSSRMSLTKALLTLSQATKCTLFQGEIICRRQFQI